MEIVESLSDLVRNLVKPDAPGLAVGIYSDGVLSQAAVAGQASVEFGSDIDVHTRFDIASMSKQFTAASALLLCREGALSLDDDIRRHLPELSLTVPVTVGQCLQHTGGLRDWLPLAAVAGRSLTRISQQQALAFVSGFREVNFKPGTEFSYSNTGYVLVASLIHRLTGLTLGEFAAERIFTPLGMNETLFREDSRLVLSRFAYGYDLSGGELRRADSEECAVGDGGLVTSLADLAPWFGFLQDGRVLGIDIRDMLLERAVTKDGQRLPYGRGLYHMKFGGRPAFGHAGYVRGYRSQLLFLPEENLGVSLLSNNSAVIPEQFAAQVLRLAAGIPEEGPTEFVNCADEADRLTGWWLDVRTDETLRIERVGAGGIRLSRGYPTGEFTLTSDGSWHGRDEFASFRLSVEGTTIGVDDVLQPGWDQEYRRCEAPDESSALPAGVYLCPELGTLATISKDSVLRLGLDMVAKIEPAPDGAFSAAGVTLRPDGDDLVLSTQRVRRMRFVRQADGTMPVGVPAGLNSTSRL